MSPLRPALLGICAETHLQELLVPFPVYHLTDQFFQMWALCSFAPVFLTRGTLHVWVPPTPHKLLTLKALTVVSSLIITCTSGTFPTWSHRERLSCATANSSWARNTGVKNLDRWSLSGFFFFNNRAENNTEPGSVLHLYLGNLEHAFILSFIYYLCAMWFHKGFVQLTIEARGMNNESIKSSVKH